MRRGLKAAWLSFAERFRVIRGPDSGYAHDCGGRVLSRVPLAGDVQLPAIAIPMVDQTGYGEVTPDVVEMQLTLPVFMLLPESPPTQNLAASGSAAVADAHDDLLRALIQGQRHGTWGDVVIEDISLVGKRLEAEKIDGVPPHAALMVQLRFRVQTDELAA